MNQREASRKFLPTKPGLLLSSAETIGSKDQLERKLQDARAPSRKNLPHRRISDAMVRLTEVDIVEDIEELRPELEARPLGDFSVLYDSEIRVEKARAAQNVPAGVAKRPVRVRSKDQRVEVLLDQLTVRPAGIELGLAEARSDKVSARKSRMRCALVPCSSPKTRRCVDWPSTPGGEYRVLRKARANGPVPFVCAPISNRPARPAASLSRRSTANSPRSRR